jgi:hypothetical protein
MHLSSFAFCMGFLNEVYSDRKIKISTFKKAKVNSDRDGIFKDTTPLQRERYVAVKFPK